MTQARLSITGLSKSFRAVQALEDLSLSIAPGERVALLGHNGAGKTTLMRLVLGFTKPDAGSIAVGGHGPGSKGARSVVSYLPENVAFQKSLTGREILAFFAKLKRTDTADIDRALDRVGLSEAANRRAGTYSKGMRQRLGLAQALLGEPGLLLLDEPTSGLDPLSRQDFYALLEVIAAGGTAILLSSHSLSEVADKTDRVAILRKGRLMADAPLADLQAEASMPIRIRVRARPNDIYEVQKRLEGRRVNGHLVELDCAAPDKMARLSAISALGDLVTDLDVGRPSLDDIYRHYSCLEDGGSAS